MTVRQEIKSQLAKLLATEDLVVEHKKVETACFNVHTRVLTLPLWEKASNTVYDLLVGHEVGHALYTPDEDWLKEHKIPPQFVNVVEDARIEKLMKRRYAAASEQGSEQQQTKSPVGGEQDEPEVKTMDSLEEALKELVNNDGYENVYLELPQLELDNVIVPNTEIHNRCREEWANWLDRMEYTQQFVFGSVDTQFNEFKRSAQKEVNYLVKEFECRKAADSYARASTARTGVLDCSKLHTYKYNEDLFRKVTTFADGKNHGLVFVLDWSGSMCDVMLDTVKQLFNLVWFCKKVAIPFEVYAFTTDYPLVTPNKTLRELSYKKRDGLVQVGEWFSMMNLLTSKTNGKVLDEQMKKNPLWVPLISVLMPSFVIVRRAIPILAMWIFMSLLIFCFVIFVTVLLI